jgi:IS30 family transposase
MVVMGRAPLSRFVQERLWAARQAGLPLERAAVAAGVSPVVARRWVAGAGGVPPRWAPPSGVRLSLAEREEIAVGLAAGEPMAAIGRRIGRPACTICREVARNSAVRGGYRAGKAQQAAQVRARRPKPARLAVHGRLRAQVEQWLALRWSPQQIAARLVSEFPDDPEMRVSHETIYQSLFVQSRGALRKELAGCLRTGRAMRRPARKSSDARGKIPAMVMISERPAEAADRAVPGHWEGDLIMGKDGRSAIGTLVERSTRFTMLLHLPTSHGADEVAAAMIATMRDLPQHLRRSITWDRGVELARYQQIQLALDTKLYFCNPHSPWQRGTNENTNRLLRHWFTKGSNLSVHTAADHARVQDTLNKRPRPTLHLQTPAQALNRLLNQAA